MSDRVLLTGISGFLGGHVALALLKAGYTVRGSVRKLDKAAKVRATLEKAGADVSRLEFVALDLLSDTGWDEAMAGVRYLQHTASPFVLETPKDPQELIGPAVEGTRRALEAALRAGVEQIVLTSSIAAIQYGHARYDRLLTEADWSDPNAPTTSAYAASKTLAERKAWEIMERAGKRQALSVINPAGIFGPLLDEDPGTSSLLVRRLLDGRLPAAPRLYMACVDVRDVAALHVAAMTDPAFFGQRCIAAEGVYAMPAMGAMLKPAFPDRRVPTATIPDWVVRIVGLFDRDIRDNMHEIGTEKRLDTSRAPRLLGRKLIDTPQAVIATGKSLVEHGLV